uniref:Uncharacterized protein n=1 Tax=Acrobeloides nanus TaxID=290746 RepID=A0A914EEP2_9BILA
MLSWRLSRRRRDVIQRRGFMTASRRHEGVMTIRDVTTRGRNGPGLRPKGPYDPGRAQLQPLVTTTS